MSKLVRLEVEFSEFRNKDLPSGLNLREADIAKMSFYKGAYEVLVALLETESPNLQKETIRKDITTYLKQRLTEERSKLNG